MMKKWNRLVTLLSVAFLMLLLVACGDNNGNGTTSDDNGDDETETGTVAIERPTPEPLPDGEQIVLRYANWNLGTEEENNLERQMVQAFMDAHPNIIIELDESYAASDLDWNGTLAVSASTGDLPDVFMVGDIGVALNNGWVLDITDLANGNPEFTALPQSMQDAMAFGGRTFAIPLQQHMQGFFVNKTMFEDLNLDAPTYGFTVEELEDAIRSVTDLNVPRVGVNNLANMSSWYAGAVNADMGYFTFDGDQFHLDSVEMIEGIRLATEWTSNGFSLYGLDEAQREMFEGGWAGETFWAGEIGLFFDGTWAANAIANYGDFEFDFIGIPGGRPIAILDILGIAATTEHPEAAYKFANWMGSGTEGFTRRMELIIENGFTAGAQPITADEGVLDIFWTMVTVPGFAEAYRNMDRVLIEWNKVTPGWAESRFHAPTGVAVGDHENAGLGDFIWQVIQNGAANYADYATRINETANEILSEIQAAID